MSGEVSETMIIYGFTSRNKATSALNSSSDSSSSTPWRLSSTSVSKRSRPSLAELAVRDLVLAVQIDQERLLRHLREVDPGGAKPFLDVLGDFEVDRHRDARLSFSGAL